MSVKNLLRNSNGTERRKENYVIKKNVIKIELNKIIFIFVVELILFEILTCYRDSIKILLS